MKKLQRNPELSIIVLTYNVEKVVKACLDSIYAGLKPDWEVIVLDNNSTDMTVAEIEARKYPGLKVERTTENLGFAGGNNLAVKKAKGKYILFLNPDTVVDKNSISFCLEYLKNNPEVGAASVKVVLGNGKLDYSCHRGFPTPWNSLCWFSGLSKIFPKSKLFSGYTLGSKDLNEEHEVDAINGAFFMLPRDLGNRLKWFDTDFFWNGEDLDLCFRLKETGHKIMYLPEEKIMHYKGVSGGHLRRSRTFYSRFDVMKLFYDKHYKKSYPSWVRFLVFSGINARMAMAYLGI